LYRLHWPDRSTTASAGYRHSMTTAGADRGDGVALTALVRRASAARRRVERNALGRAHSRPPTAASRASSASRTPTAAQSQLRGRAGEFAVRDQVSLIAIRRSLSARCRKVPGRRAAAAARVTRWARLTPSGDAAQRATAEYVAVARRHGLDPAQMAIAFVMSQRFVASTLIGATTMEQLKTNLASEALRLPAEVLDELEQVQRRNPNPCS
jgi:aryl-alcohol dehydrogenase-like predicted oxidoreductase